MKKALVAALGFAWVLGVQTSPALQTADALIESRVVNWDGVANVRDLGGLAGLDGRLVRKGRIYRSAGLNANAYFRGKDRKRLPKSEWRGPGATLIKPETVRYVVDTLGVKALHKPMDLLEPDGCYPEGVGYWRYGISFNVYAIAMMESACGTDFGLSGKNGFRKTAEYPNLATGPLGMTIGYSDCGTSRGAEVTWKFITKAGARADGGRLALTESGRTLEAVRDGTAATEWKIAPAEGPKPLNSPNPGFSVVSFSVKADESGRACAAVVFSLASACK